MIFGDGTGGLFQSVIAEKTALKQRFGIQPAGQTADACAFLPSRTGSVKLYARNISR
ncbi:MAG: hypothetical protein WAZ34_06940 [Rhodocyclaceae bacterium]